MDERCGYGCYLYYVSRYKHNMNTSCTLVALFSRPLDTRSKFTIIERLTSEGLLAQLCRPVRRVLIEAVSIDGLTTDASDIRESLARTNRKEEGI